MARIRTIKPETATDRTLACCSIAARYTFLLIISLADDYGLLLAEPRQLLGLLYPHDVEVEEEEVRAWVAELVEKGRLRWRTTADAAQVLEIVHWSRHQVVHRPGKPTLLNSLQPFAEIPPVTDRNFPGVLPGISLSPAGKIPARIGRGKGIGKGKRERDLPNRLASDPVSAEPAAAGLNGPRPTTWVGQAIDVWRKHQGEPNAGKLGKALKPLLGRYDQPTLLARFENFAQSEDAKYSFPYFAEHIERYATIPTDGVPMWQEPDPIREDEVLPWERGIPPPGDPPPLTDETPP